MDDIAEQLAIRDRFLRNRWKQLSLEQRIAEMYRLQKRSWDLLRSSPTGYAAFMRRNMKQRAIDPWEPSAS
jgi:hypothetical protein